MLLYPPDESRGYYGLAGGPRHRPRPSRFCCKRASTDSFEPIIFKFGVDICYGKGTKPIVFEGNPKSKMAAGGHFGKKSKPQIFVPKRVSGNLRQNFFFFFFCLLIIFSALDSPPPPPQL